MVPGCLTTYFLFPLCSSVPTSPCHDPPTGWWVTACYSVYFASFNRCRCMRCWNVFPRSPQFLVILLKWLCICHNFHIKIICFNCTRRAVQIICCKQLIEFRSVCCLQIVPCLLAVLGSCWVIEVVRDISDVLGWQGRNAIAYGELIWNAMGAPYRLAPSPVACLVFSRLSELFSSLTHVCVESSYSSSIIEAASVLAWQEQPLWTEHWSMKSSKQIYILTSAHVAPVHFCLSVQHSSVCWSNWLMCIK